MPKRSSKKKNIKDTNVLAAHIVEEATKDTESEVPEGKNPYAVALGRLGGKKGGPARARKLTAEQRKEIAKRASAVRWAAKD